MSDIRQKALDYHEFPIPGKMAVCVTKPAQSSYDLSLAYSPGVAEPVREIAANPENAYRYTAKGNTVAVISNGTAILGLGNLGPLASKPVMEGKSLLFKHFANIDATDIQVKHRTTEEFINTVEAIADTFGGINLEDIKAPECFEIERELIARCNVPVFHDDQHGTAIVTAAGMINALEIHDKQISHAVFVCMGAGAAAIACMTMLVKCGAQRENIYMLDRQGVIHTRREDLNEYKALFANNTDKRTLQDVIKDADVFLGLSGPDVLSAEDVAMMAPNPVIFACSNPDPEINPAIAHATRSDVIMGTGRSDYPNQVNNVLCFPFIFRGALDVRAAQINDEMKIAAVYAIAGLAKEPVPDAVLAAYPNVTSLSFGAEYVLPKPMDPRLLPRIAKAVAQAAIDSGVAAITTLPADYMAE